MGKSISSEKIKEIYSLRNQGKSYAKISRIVDVTQATARRHYHNEVKRLDSGAMTKEQLYDAMIKDRMTMYVKDVAKKYGFSEKHVTYITIKSPLRDKFLRKSSVGIKPKNIDRANQMAIDRTKMGLHQVAEKYGLSPRSVSNLTRGHELKDKFKQSKKVKKPKPKELKKPKENSRNSEIIQELSTGQLKKKAIDRILPKRDFDPAKQRHVHIPEKKLTISVSAEDPRTDDEIRATFLQRAKEDMESCKIRDQRKHTRNFKTKSRGISEVSVRGIF